MREGVTYFKVKAAEPAIAKDINMTFFKKFITNRPSEPDTKRTKSSHKIPLD